MMTWLGRRRAALWGALVLTFAMAGTAGATAGVMLQLGVVNTHHATTVLTGKTSGAELRVVNRGTGPALALGVSTNRPAFTVTSSAKIPKLNADRVDGLDSSAFQRRVTGSCGVGSAIAGIAADGTVTCAVDGVDGGDAATLDGLPASAFLRSTVTTKVTGPWANNAGQLDVGSADCDPGSVAIGGGVSTQGTTALPWAGFEPSSQAVNSSAPNPNGKGWSVSVTNGGATHRTFHVYVICIAGGSAVSSTEAPAP